MKRSLIILSLLLVIATNAIALIGAWRNRAGIPVQTIELTERELPLELMGQDNSGVGLTIQWNRPLTRMSDSQFDRSMLEGIGFDFRLPPDTPGKDRSLLPRAGYVVLEYQGAKFEHWLQEEQKKSQPDQKVPEMQDKTRNPETMSRLFPIDLGKDPAALRSRYPDQGRYLILRAIVRARIEDVMAPDGKTITSHYYSGYLAQILPFYVNVPLPYSRTLATLKPQPWTKPRYSVTLSFGSNLEPWIIDVKRQN
jgi:hypothetical protein